MGGLELWCRYQFQWRDFRARLRGETRTCRNDVTPHVAPQMTRLFGSRNVSRTLDPIEKSSKILISFL